MMLVTYCYGILEDKVEQMPDLSLRDSDLISEWKHCFISSFPVGFTQLLLFSSVLFAKSFTGSTVTLVTK